MAAPSVKREMCNLMLSDGAARMQAIPDGPGYVEPLKVRWWLNEHKKRESFRDPPLSIAEWRQYQGFALLAGKALRARGQLLDDREHLRRVEEQIAATSEVCVADSMTDGRSGGSGVVFEDGLGPVAMSPFCSSDWDLDSPLVDMGRKQRLLSQGKASKRRDGKAIAKDGGQASAPALTAADFLRNRAAVLGTGGDGNGEEAFGGPAGDRP